MIITSGSIRQSHVIRCWCFLLVCVASLLPGRSARAETSAVLLRQFSAPITAPPYSDPADFTGLGATVVFSAKDTVNGRELWKTDGTAAGTARISDINPGTGDSSPSDFISFHGAIFFIAHDANFKLSVWKTDGTAQGTTRVSDPNITYVTQLTVFNNQLFFYGGGDQRAGLWTSDGTPAGTSLLYPMPTYVCNDDDERHYACFPEVSNFVQINGVLFFDLNIFVSFYSSKQHELWRSDGTPAGTLLIQHIPTSIITAAQLVAQANTLFLIVENSLWKSDGTPAGTTLLKTMNQFSYGYIVSSVSVGGKLFFTVSNSDIGDLWQSDGTTAGTVLVKSTIDSFSLATMGNTVFFSSGDTLWRTDGTQAGTLPVRDIAGNISVAAVVDGTLFFGVSGDADDTLWRTDGTAAGTLLIKHFANPSAYSKALASFTSFNGKLFFAGDDGSAGMEPWISDGTAAGTALIADLAVYPNDAAVTHPISINGTLFFGAHDLATGTELWKSDGTPGGTTLVKDITPGATGSDPQDLINVGGTLLFTAFTPANGRELWRSDGSAAGTVLIKEIGSGKNSAALTQFTAINGLALFVVPGDQRTTSDTLWRSDGTEAGTLAIKGFGAGAMLINGINVNGTLMFMRFNAASDNHFGPDLWRSDGTDQGTTLVATLPFGSLNSYIQPHMVALHNTLFFTLFGTELWRSDGTSANTVRVKRFPLVSYYIPGTMITDLIGAGDTLFFKLDNLNSSARELWESDGTEAGTRPLNSILVPYGDESVIAAINNRLLFSNFDAQTGQELWGITEGLGDLHRIADIAPGTQDSKPHAFAPINASLAFFAASDGTHGVELWQTDGSAGCTQMAQDVTPGNTNPEQITLVGDKLVFTANDDAHGLALWSLPLAALHAAPAAAPRSIVARTGATIAGQLAGSTCGSAGTLSYTLTQPPQHGTLALTDAATGRFSYVPAAGFSGTDTFAFKVSNGTSASSEAQVTIQYSDQLVFLPIIRH